jgi:uncharacterized protein (TIGR00369 family)
MHETPPLRMTAAEVEGVIRTGLPAAAQSGMVVEEVRAGYARTRLPFAKWMLRPGNVISGPTLFTAADAAMYALVMAHIGPAVMSVTADLNIRFLSPAPAGDVIAEARLLRLGLRLAVMEVALYTGADKDLVAHVTGTYALPRSRPVS